MLELVPRGELFGADSRPFENEVADEVLRVKPRVRFGLKLRLVVFRGDAGGCGPLVEELAFDGDFEIGQLGLLSTKLVLGVPELLGRARGSIARE